LNGTEVSVFGNVNDRSHCGSVHDRGKVVEASPVQCGEHVVFRRCQESCCFGEAHLAGKVSHRASQFGRKNSGTLRPDVVHSLGTASTLVREVLGTVVSKTYTQL